MHYRSTAIQFSENAIHVLPCEDNNKRCQPGKYHTCTLEWIT